jgi:TusA-related sulfurtransferase
MSIAQAKFEQCAIRIHLVAEARGVSLDQTLKQVDMAMALLKSGEVLMLYSSDFINQDKIPEWINKQGNLFLGMMNDENFYKILIIKQ